MGVRGLTTFIDKEAHKYLEAYELHDTYIVIDGNNIACQLYNWYCTKNDCFGGDYDKYAKTVHDFFQNLSDCNVTPLIVFDGGCEDRKLRTVYKRMRDKVKATKHMNSVTQSSMTAFPLLMRDLFVEIVLKLGLRTVRWDFEADAEMACLARTLNCPVLSYDSDFYVFGVLYIPFKYWQMAICKIKNSNPVKNCIRCWLYRLENFVKVYGGLNKDNLPLIAILLGNDYISKSVFRNFYSQIKLPKRRNASSDQQRKIASVIKWMQSETYESAVRKILGRLKKEQRKHIAEQIQSIAEGYTCTDSKLLPYLNITLVKKPNSVVTFDAATVLSDLEDENNEPDCGDTSDSTSEASDLSSVSLDFAQGSNDNIPNWFKERFRKCHYPPSFMDILVRNTYFCTPQVEDYTNRCSHQISANIISVNHRILSSGTIESLTYCARAESTSKIKRYQTPPCILEVPTLAQVKDINREAAENLLFKVLEIENVNFIHNLPASWQLYMLAVLFWIKNASPKVTYSHVYSLILCAIVIDKVDKQVGYYRSTRKFTLKFEKRLKTLESRTSVVDNSTNFTDPFSNINDDDSLLCLKELLIYFQMAPKMTTHLKSYDIRIVDCFAQFQSCLLHIKYLNMLLNKPLSDCYMAELYDGTFLYNMCSDLLTRSDVNVFLSQLLKRSPSVMNCFKVLIDELISIMSCNMTNVIRAKRRRKRKKNHVLSNTDCFDVEEDSEGEAVVCVNNRFSLLHLAK